MPKNKKAQKIVLTFAILIALIVFPIVAHNFKKYEITLITDNSVQVLYSKKMTVKELLHSMDVFVDKDAKINKPLELEISEDMEISVENPKTYVVRMGDSMKTVRTFATDVSDILKEAGFIIDEDDYTEPSLTAEVKENDIIALYKVAYYEETIKKEVGFEILKKENANLNKGEENIISEGNSGEKIEVYKIRTVNGEEAQRELVSEKMTRLPQNKVVEVGTKKVYVASNRSSWITLDRKNKPASNSSVNRESSYSVAQNSGGNFDGNAKKSVVMKATYYSDSPEENGGWSTTASGTALRRGVVAVDPNVIPLGTRLYIESLDGSPDYGYAMAEDTGSAIKGNRIDLCTGSESADGLGSKNVRVHILSD